MKEELFDEIRHISIQKIADEANRKALFTSLFEARIA
jgi:hypothetical protein